MNNANQKTCWCGGNLGESAHPAYHICQSCGSLVAKDKRSSGELREFYTFDGYWHDYVSKFNYPTVEERGEILLRDRIPIWYDTLTKYKPEISTILEIGCSEGSFLHYCKQKGIKNTVGIEVDKDTCEFAMRHFDLEHVVPGLFPEVSLPFQKYDAIAGFDVLEHFVDPVSALKSVKDLLADDGVVIFQTPSYKGESEGWIHFKPLEHLYLFNRKSVVKLLNMAGLDVVSIHGGKIDEDMILIACKKEAVNGFSSVPEHDSVDDSGPTTTIAIGLIEHMGDIVACEPVARHLRAENPEAHILWCIRKEYRELVDTNPYVDETIVVDCLTEWILLSESGAFDRVVDLHIDRRVCPTCNVPLEKDDTGFVINGENYFHAGSLLGAFSKGAGLPVLDEGPEVYIPKSAVENVRLLDLPSEYVVVHARSNELVKDWTTASWTKLISSLRDDKNIAIVEVGSNPTVAAEDDRIIDLCGKLTILETAEVIRRARLFIGVDSGPAHLANAVGTYGIVLLGRYRNFDHYNPFSGRYADGTNAELIYNEDGPASAIAPDAVITAANQAIEKLRAERELVAPSVQAGGETVPVKSDDAGTRLIAFYLPQFHPTPENDKWWGKGFTEWRNVAGATPLFPGHNQPQMPSDLGFYDLRLPEIRNAQADLAREYGISGFCYWHYWFNGKVLLDRPFEEVLRLGEPDFPFCLAWANENWTRRWDGQDKEILQEQTYGGEEDDLKHFEWMLRAFKDRRYMKVDGKPIFLVYRPADKPDVGATISTWKRLAAENGFPGLYLIAMRTTFGGIENPRETGYDAELAFQPIFEKLMDDMESAEWIAPKHELALYEYRKARNIMAGVNAENVSRGDDTFATVVPSWDNTARRKGLQAFVLMNSTPGLYEEWLRDEIKRVSNRGRDRRIVFINAWNEWAEGNHLEPDLKFGIEYLEATKRALSEPSDKAGGKSRSCEIYIDPHSDAKIERMMEIGRRAYSSGKYEEAELWLNRALRKAANTIASHYHKGVAFISDGKEAEAAAESEQTSAAKSMISQIHNDLGILYYSRGYKEKGRHHLELAAFFDGKNLIAKKNLADVLLAANEKEKAINLYKELMNTGQLDVESLVTVADVCREASRFDDSKAFYEDALQIDSENIKAARGLAMLFSVMNTSMDTDDLYQKSQELVSSGNLAEASATLEQILEADPKNAMALNDLAVLNSVTGRIEEAIRLLENLTAIDPRNAIGWKNLGKLYVRAGFNEDALRAYSKALEIVPDDTETIVATADTCSALMREEEASFFYNRAFEIDPGDEGARRGLNSIHKKRAQQEPNVDLYDMAQKLIEEGNSRLAIEFLNQMSITSPPQARVHNDLGVLYCRDGRTEIGERHFKEALELEPENLIALKNLFTVYSGQGRRDEASGIQHRMNQIESAKNSQNRVSIGKDPAGRSRRYEEVPCHFCGSRDAVPFRKSADIVKCAKCGTVYLRTRFTQDQMVFEYQRYADEGSHLSLPRNTEEVHASGLRRDNFMKKVLSLTRSKGTLLDVGCAWGAFLDNARSKGFKVKGIEITQRTADFAIQSMGLDVTSTQFTDAPLDSNSISVVTMLHSLEHLPSPKEAMIKAYDVLKPGGLFAGIVPNIESYCSTLLEDDWDWLQPMYHYVHYSPSTLRKRLEEAGFHIERISTSTGDYDHSRFEDLVRQVYHPESDEELVELMTAIEEQGFGEEIWFFARKPYRRDLTAVSAAFGKEPDDEHDEDSNPAEAESFPDILESMKKVVDESTSPGIAVSVVVPYLHAYQSFERCLNAVHRSFDKFKARELILVAANLSAVEMSKLQKVTEGREYIKIVEGIGVVSYADACNLGAARARGKLVAFVDPDIEIGPEWLSTASSRMDGDKSAVLVGGRILFADRTIETCWIEFEKGVDPIFEVWPAQKFRGLQDNDPRANVPLKVHALEGHCILVSKEFLDEAGGFSGKNGVFFEEVDLCLKAETSGRTVFYDPCCVAVHRSEATSGQWEAEANERRKEAIVALYRQWGSRIRIIASAIRDEPKEIIGGSSVNTGNRNADSLYRDAQSLISNGRYERAKQLLEETLRISPDHADAHNDLAVLYHQDGDLDRAATHLERCVEIKPGDAIAVKNLAVLYSRSGKFDRALALFQKALEKDPEDIQALMSIADICVRLSKFQDAKFIFNQILAITQDYDLREKIIASISELDRLPSPGSDSRTVDHDGEYDRVLSNRAGQITPAGNDLVTIVIPVFNKVEFTKRCLRSIKENVVYKDYEVVVVDNASTDETQSFMKEWTENNPRVKYIRNESNMGFVDACNLGAEQAKGKYVVLLNNDTEVNRNWLEALVDFAGKTDDCGAVGSKLIYPDGRLQEAGGIIFSDGNGWNYGRGLNPDHPKFNFVREVDYISGASLMIRKELWDKLGGLDKSYAPAYYEDSDLCFGIRKLGYKVYYEPRSSLTHFEGITSGTNLAEGFKKFQTVNRPKFVKKWKDELAVQCENNPENVERASSRGIAGRVLVVDPILPMFDRAAGSLHLFNILKVFREMGLHITYISTNWGLYDRYRPILQDMGIETYAGDQDAMQHFGYRVIYPKINYKSLFEERQFDFALIDFWYQAEYYLPIIRKYSPNTKIIIDTEDVHFVRELREAQLKRDPQLRSQAREKKKREVSIYRKADRVWVVTEEDKTALLDEKVDVPIDIRPVIHNLPAIGKGYDGREGLLFVGNFNHTPNIDAVTYFVKEVFPLVAESIPEVKLYIVGNDPHSKIAELASKNIVVAGYVPELAGYYDRSKVSIAPLRYGAGLKGKIVESLSFGVPVVTTSIGVEGTGLHDGEDVLIADDPKTMAGKIVEAYSSKELWTRLSQNGRSKMESKWSRETGKKMLQEILSAAGSRQVARHVALTSIVMLTFNQLDYTRLTIDSIRKHTKAPYELIVVDNASTDGTVEYLKAQRDVRGVFNDENVGFPSGCNQGMEIAVGDYIVLLNNDVIVSDGWLTGLIECAGHSPKIGIVGPMSNRISGGQLEKNIGYKKVNQIQEFAAKYRRKNRKRWLEAPRVAGFCMLIKRELVDKIGGLDTAFGMGNCEDDDYCLRSRLAGYGVVIAGDVFIHHFGSASFGKDGLEKYREFIKANELIFKGKWGITPLEWWREGKEPTKISDLWIPITSPAPDTVTLPEDRAPNGASANVREMAK